MNTKKQILYEGQYMQLVKRDRWEYVERKNITGIVGIVPITPDNKIILIKQYRMAVALDCIEIPAGLVGDELGKENEPLIDAAKRELLEETGYKAGKMEWLALGPPSAGLSAELMNFYLATDLKKVGSGGGDASENISTFEVPLGGVEAWLKEREKEGCLIDTKVYLGLYFALKKK